MQGFRSVHLPSLVVGAAMIVGLVALTGMSTVQSAIATTVFRIKYVPDPNDIVNLAEGTPYVVPDGKVLIITDWNLNPADSVGWWPQGASIRVDGTGVWGGLLNPGGGPGGGSLQAGVRTAAGQTVTLDTVPSNPYLTVVASGYLAKAN